MPLQAARHKKYLAISISYSSTAMPQARHYPPATGRNCRVLEHDPEKWEPVFGKDHAQTKS
jgi:hypothetical protein